MKIIIALALLVPSLANANIYGNLTKVGGLPEAITFTPVAGSTAEIRTSAFGSQALTAPSGGNPMIINAGANGVLSLNAVSSGPVVMSLAPSSNVGIKTANPTLPLDVNGAAQFGSGAHKSTFSALGSLTLSGDLNAPGVNVGTTTDNSSLARFSTNTFGNAPPFSSYINMFDQAGWQLHLISEDVNGLPGINAEGYGQGGGVVFNFAEGNIATPSDPMDGDEMGFIAGRGWESGFFRGRNAFVSLLASGDWSPTNRGELFDFFATSPGSTSPTEVMAITGGGIFLDPTTALVLTSDPLHPQAAGLFIQNGPIQTQGGDILTYGGTIGAGDITSTGTVSAYSLFTAYGLDAATGTFTDEVTAGSSVTASAFFGDGSHLAGIIPTSGGTITGSLSVGGILTVGAGGTTWYYCSGSTGGTYDGNLARGNSNAGACQGGTWIPTNIKSN